MKINPFWSVFLLIFLYLGVPAFSFASNLSYEVVFVGVEEGSLIEGLRSSSQLEQLTSRGSISELALKRRAEEDIDDLIKVLETYAYYNAKIDLKIDSEKHPIVVTYIVDTGPIYPLADFRIVNVGSTENALSLDCISLDKLGINLGSPAYPLKILAAEDAMLRFAAEQGFPQFHITKREVIADQQSKKLSVILYVDSGPYTYFGKTTISGHTNVKEEFLRNKIAWEEGRGFNLEDIAKTQASLEKSGLFSSATITYQQPEPGQDRLPMEIQLIEAKHRTIAGGVSYTTQRGLGAMGEWEHRNVFGLGQRINLRANMWSDTQEVKLSYVLPDFGQVDQNLIWQAALDHQKLEGYDDRSMSFSGIIDRKISDQFKISYGLEYKSIVIKHSDNNGSFNLAKAPLQLRWSTANSLLDPTEGHSINLKVAPTLRLDKRFFAYCPTTLAATYYYPLTADHRLVFAAKGTIGSIIGGDDREIPPSELFFAGGENSLRGYRYQSVSPLGKDGKPKGGNSLMTLSLESRFRLSEKIGLVAFYEVGNVYEKSIPQFAHKQLQSVGVGLRYHTPVGPLRFDVAVPLNPRKQFDNSFQIYMSIGQSF